MLRSALLALPLSALATVAVAQETVHFTSLDGTTNLTAYLSRPGGDAPRPALVLMHGCSGLFNRNGRIFPLYQAWMRALVVQGYVALTVDGASPRGFGQTCTAGAERATMWRDRSKDAFAALQYLQARSFVRADRVGLMGWSQGGGAVLLSINDKSIARPSPLAHDFRAAVSFYPAVCSERLQSRPYTQVEPQSWTTRVPLLVLFGKDDNWTLFPCMGLFLSRSSPERQIFCPSSVSLFDLKARFFVPTRRFADVVARRSCQGWPPRQPCGMLRACQAIP